MEWSSGERLEALGEGEPFEASPGSCDPLAGEVGRRCGCPYGPKTEVGLGAAILQVLYWSSFDHTLWSHEALAGTLRVQA